MFQIIQKAVVTAVMVTFLNYHSPAHAQNSFEINIPVGNEKNQIGFEARANADCAAPAAVLFENSANILILDPVNGRIVRINPFAADDIDIVISDDTLRYAKDMVKIDNGYLVLGSNYSTVFELDKDFRIVDQKNISDDLKNTGSEKIEINLIKKYWMMSNIDRKLSDIIVTRVSSNQAIYTIQDVEYELNSFGNILNHQALFINSEIFIALVEESFFSGDQEVLISRFVRWSLMDPEKVDDAFRAHDSSGCTGSRYFATSDNGLTVYLRSFEDRIEIRSAHYEPVGRQPNIRDYEETDTVSSGEGVFEFLEKYNQFDETKTVSAVPTISRSQILERAWLPLNHKWIVNIHNIEPDHIRASCPKPRRQGEVWRLPEYLKAMGGRKVVSVPYKWGGYFSKFDTFKRGQDGGRPTGDTCTCRKESLGYCVVQSSPRPVGLDCSGFVSYAWNAGNYYTTSRLPKFATKIKWRDLKPGDIVNKRGSHVRLVEKIENSMADDPTYTVIESSVSCGKVCRRSYRKSRLLAQGYLPFRRPNVVD